MDNQPTLSMTNGWRAARAAYLAKCEQLGVEAREDSTAWRSAWVEAFGCPDSGELAEAVGDLPRYLDARARENLSEPCSLMLMRCADGRRAHKVFGVDAETGEVEGDACDVGLKFVSRTVEVRGLYSLFDRLSALEGARGHYVLRGSLREGVDGTKAHRRLCNADKHGEATTYEDADRRWVMLDVDGLEWPAGLEDGDGATVAGMLRLMLPDCFQGAGMVWQWSASAGVGGWGKVKMHMWFWLDRAVCSASWRDWFKRDPSGLVDNAVFNPVQAHYTAAPVFEDGLEDPVAVRTGIVEGPVVTVPRALVGAAKFERRAARERTARVERSARLRAGQAANDTQGRAYARGALRRACESVEAAGEGSRHETLRDESLATARFVREGVLDEWEWRNALTSAGQVALPKGRWGEIERLLGGALELDGARGAA